MQIAAAYVRVSTDDQTEYSPSAQLDEILSFASKNNYHIPQEFIFEDAGISGRSAEKRPAFQEMLLQSRKKSNKIKFIIVHKFDRFSRNKDDAVLYKSLLKKDGIKVISVKEPIPQDDKFAVIYESMLEAMAEYYSLNLAEEVKKTMIKKAHLGEYQAAPPFGYSMINKILTPIPDEAHMVHFIFESFALGKESMFSLSRQMNQLGFRTHRGGAFENRTIQYILNNPVYKGYSRWTPTGRTRRAYQNPESIVSKGIWTPIVSDELWEAAAQRISREKKTHYAHKRPETEGKHWVSGMIKCSNCGRSLVIATTYKNNNAFHMQCGGYNHGQCHISHSLSTNRLFPALFASLEEVALGIAPLDAYHITRVRRDTEDLDSIETIMEKNKSRLGKAKEAYLAGVDTLEDYRQAKLFHDAELEHLKIKRQLAQEKQLCPFDHSDFEGRTTSVISILQDDAQNMESKKMAFKSIVEKVIYNKEADRLELFFISE